MFCLKYNLDIQTGQPSTSYKKQENLPKPTTQNKDPFEMDNMKKFLQKISNEMVDLKKTNTENQTNNRGFVRPPFRKP